MTLEEFRDLINKSNIWHPYFFDIITINKWIIEGGDFEKICNDGKSLLRYNKKGIAEIVDL